MMQVRRYQSGDDDQIVAAWRAASAFAHPFLPPEFFADEAQKIREVYLPNAKTWVCVEGSAVVGFIAVLDDEVGGLFVHPAVWRRGAGRSLMDTVVAEAYGAVSVEVFKANRIGRAFYDSYGFKFEREHVCETTGQPVLRLSYALKAAHMAPPQPQPFFCTDSELDPKPGGSWLEDDGGHTPAGGSR